MNRTTVSRIENGEVVISIKWDMYRKDAPELATFLSKMSSTDCKIESDFGSKIVARRCKKDNFNITLKCDSNLNHGDLKCYIEFLGASYSIVTNTKDVAIYITEIFNSCSGAKARKINALQRLIDMCR